MVKTSNMSKSTCIMPIMSISNNRINSDGKGIRSLVTVSGCPLYCKKCINNYCHFYPKEKTLFLTTEDLYNRIKTQTLYYNASNGGVTFGGGEPLLYSDFIIEFMRKYNKLFNSCIETSLNTEIKDLTLLAKLVDTFYIDIKDMDPAIYYNYTGKDNALVYDNMKQIVRFQNKVVIRLPSISGFNTSEDVQNSYRTLKKMGFSRFNFFSYREVKQ